MDNRTRREDQTGRQKFCSIAFSQKPRPSFLWCLLGQARLAVRPSPRAVQGGGRCSLWLGVSLCVPPRARCGRPTACSSSACSNNKRVAKGQRRSLPALTWLEAMVYDFTKPLLVDSKNRKEKRVLVFECCISMTRSEGVFTQGDARSFFGLTSKISPLGSMLNFDADVKKMTARHQYENPLSGCTCSDLGSRVRIVGLGYRAVPQISWRAE